MSLVIIGCQRSICNNLSKIQHTNIVTTHWVNQCIQFLKSNLESEKQTIY